MMPYLKSKSAPVSVVAALALVVLCGCNDMATIEVDATPGDAVVWLGDHIVGPAPVRVRVPPGRSTLRISRPAHEDHIVELSPADLPPDRRVDVTLEPIGFVALTCTSTPSGADVFLDGEFRGQTPLSLSGLQRRGVELAFRMNNRQQVTRTVDLTTGEAETQVAVALPSLTEDYYLQQIELAPDALAHYVDLAHHYVLEHRFDDAAAVFNSAIKRVLRSRRELPDSTRLWSELQRVIEKQYDYGGADEQAAAREALLAMMDRIASDRSAKLPVAFAATYIGMLDSANRKQHAQEAFERAWRHYPNDRSLLRVQKKHRLARP